MDVDFFLVQLILELHQKLVDDAQDDLLVQRLERDHRIEPVTKLRREHALDVGHLVAGLARVRETDRRALQQLGACVRGHHDDHVAEIGLAAVVIGQSAVVHDLQQNVENVRMRLFDLVKEQYRVRLLGDRFGQQAALIESYIARRRADQPADCMPLHVFRHVESNQFDAQCECKLLRNFGLAHARRSRE